MIRQRTLELFFLYFLSLGLSICIFAFGSLIFMLLDLGTFQLYMSSGSKTWDARPENEKRIFHNFWRNRKGEPLTEESIAWINEEGFADERHGIIYGTSHRLNLTPPPAPSPTRAYHSDNSDSFEGDFSGDENSTIYSSGMSEQMQNWDLNELGEQSQSVRNDGYRRNRETPFPREESILNVDDSIQNTSSFAPPTYGVLPGGLSFPINSSILPSTTTTTTKIASSEPIVSNSIKSLTGFDGQGTTFNNSLTISINKVMKIESTTIVNHNYMTRFVTQCLSPEFHLNVMGLISPDMWYTFMAFAKSRFCNDVEKLKRIALLKSYVTKSSDQRKDDTSLVGTWTKDSILHLLKEIYPKQESDTNDINNIVYRLGEVIIRFDCDNSLVEVDTMRNIYLILTSNTTPLTAQQEKAILKIWWKQLSAEIQFKWVRIMQGVQAETIEEFIDQIGFYAQDLRNTRDTSVLKGWEVRATATTKFLGKGGEKWSLPTNSNTPSTGSSAPTPPTSGYIHPSRENKKRDRDHDNSAANSAKSQKKPSAANSAKTQPPCIVCGRFAHPGVCPLEWHPNANLTQPGTIYIDSDAGKAMKAACGRSFINPTKDENNKIIHPPSNAKHSSSSNSKGKFTSGSCLLDVNFPIKLVVDPTNMLVLSSIQNHSNSEDLLSVSICVFQDTEEIEERKGDKTARHSGEALLDSGSLAGNFINQTMLDMLGVEIFDSVDRPRLPICSGLDNVCYDYISVTYKLVISFITELDTPFSFIADFRLLPKSPFDLIIGRETIKDTNLGVLVPSHFVSEEIASLILALHTTHPLLLNPILLHGEIRSEKDNRGHEPRDTSAVGCNTESCGCSHAVDLISTDNEDIPNPGALGVSAVSGTHTWRQGEEQSSTPNRCYPPEPWALPQTQRTFVTALATQSDHLFATILPDDDLMTIRLMPFPRF